MCRASLWMATALTLGLASLPATKTAVWAAASTPATKTTTAKPAAKSTTKPAASKPAAKPKAKPAAKPAAKSAAKPAAKPATPAPKKPITASAPASTVVAIVGSQKITKGQVDNAAWQRYAVSLTSELIDKACVQQAAQAQGVQITKADIDEKVNELKGRVAQQGMTFDQFKSQYNLTDQQLRDELKTNIYVEKAAAKSIKVTDQDLAQYIKARHILLSTSGNTPEEKAKSEEDNKKKLEDWKAEILAGKAKFDELAKEHSDDPGSKQQGGDLGWFKRGTMVADFDNAAFALKPGDISEPVKTNYGYHLIQVEKLGKDATPAEKAELTKRITDEKLRPEMTAWYLRVKEDCVKKTTRYVGENPKPAPAMTPTPPPAPKPAPAPKPKPATGNGSGGTEAPPPPPPAPTK
ncbi:MAG: peptidylprolyl isomerase [Armatimonadetes bacterium]|nr:peptidylprolyl isomerase [Armatimonadota bacterium]